MRAIRVPLFDEPDRPLILSDDTVSLAAGEALVFNFRGRPMLAGLEEVLSPQELDSLVAFMATLTA